MAIVDMFIKLGKMKGESRDKAHGGEIDVISFIWGGNNVFNVDGAAMGRTSVKDLSFKHHIDRATPLLWSALTRNTNFDKATLTVRKAGEKPVEYLVIEMTNVLVSSVAINGDADSVRKTEDVTLKFEAFKMIYTPQDEKGIVGDSVEVNWSNAENRGS